MLVSHCVKSAKLELHFFQTHFPVWFQIRVGQMRSLHETRKGEQSRGRVTRWRWVQHIGPCGSSLCSAGFPSWDRQLPLGLLLQPLWDLSQWACRPRWRARAPSAGPPSLWLETETDAGFSLSSWVPVLPHGFQFVLAFPHISSSFLSQSLALPTYNDFKLMTRGRDTCLLQTFLPAPTISLGLPPTVKPYIHITCSGSASLIKS